jgi:hypothetical protein
MAKEHTRKFVSLLCLQILAWYAFQQSHVFSKALHIDICINFWGQINPDVGTASKVSINSILCQFSEVFIFNIEELSRRSTQSARNSQMCKMV